MKTRVNLNFVLWVVILTLSLIQSSWATSRSDSWIVRSEVQSNQSIWGVGPGQSFSISDTYAFNTGVFRGGFEWNVALDPGTITGNAEGVVLAKYDNWLSKPGKTNISLSYSGLSNESHIGTNVGANISIKPYFGAYIWPTWVDTSLPVNLVNVDFNTGKDFTTGLGSANVTDSQRHDLLELGGDVLLVSYGIDVFMENNTTFAPELYNGIIKYKHVDSQTEGSMVVNFWGDTIFASDGSTPIDQMLDFELDLDKPGLWELSLEDFYLEQSDFSTELDLGVQFSVGVPLFGTEVALNADISVAQSGVFNPRFDFHNLLGDTTLGRFSIYVDAVPIPASVWLFGSGLIGIAVLARRKKT